ncbi:response regulator transcription factor [uncultured Algibacter sp.]|uniref:LytR/AlgR family response regulator transcription factor n=1 Tax=uncultured Algibacter sp. TaxID=298659 RepID=UPI00321725B4
MKIYVVEDEIIPLDDILITIKSLNHQCVGYSGDAFEALEQIESLKPDVVLMDIHLNGKQQGIQLAREINKKSNIPLIYTSSDITKSVINEAADTNPISYIIKPVNEKDLLAALILAENKISSINDSSPDELSEIFIKNRKKLEKINVNDILFAFTDTKNYCTIVTEDTKLTVRNSIVGLQQLLNHEQFIQTHRAYIINWKKVDAFYEGTQSIEIKEHNIPLGRTYKDSVYKRLKML